MELVTYSTRPDLGKGDQVGAPEATSGVVETAPVPERQGKGGKGGNLTQERRDSRAGSVDPPVEVEPQSVMGMVELVISPPLEPVQVLKLHKWLRDVVDGHLSEIHPSSGGDTVLEINIRRLSPLVRLLDELPLVAAVTEQPYEEDEAPKRLRLALKRI